MTRTDVVSGSTNEPTSNLIKDGDRVLVYSGYGHMHPITIAKNTKTPILDTSISHDEIIGCTFGAVVEVDCKNKGGRRRQRSEMKADMPPRKRKLALLRLTPELWSLSLPHRTQIIFAHDISTIIMGLDIQPGCCVLEAGTGSGSLTHSLARSVRPNGHVHTCEYHAGRHVQAEKEFFTNGIAQYVTTHHGDICDSTFVLDKVVSAAAEQKLTINQEEWEGFDAIFLDMPSPWLFVPNLVTHKILRSGGTFCAFSPCVEQVQKTRQGLQETKQFIDIRIVEVVLRTYRATREQSFQTVVEPSSPFPSVKKILSQQLCVAGGGLGHSAYLTFARKFCRRAKESDADAGA